MLLSLKCPLSFLYRKERRHPLWIQLHCSNVCTNLPNLLLRSTPTPTPADPPHHPHPPPPRPPHGTSGPCHASTTPASSSSRHCPQPTARLGIPAPSTTMPLPDACPTPNCCASPSSTLRTDVYGPCSSLPTSLPTNVLQEAIRIKARTCTYKRSVTVMETLLYMGLFCGVSLWCRRWTLLLRLENDRRQI